MALELGKVKVQDLTENDWKIIGIGINDGAPIKNVTGENEFVYGKNPDNKQYSSIFSVNYTTLTQAKDNLKNLILTHKGERIMNPEFGCDIWKLLFEPIIEDDIDRQIENTIVDAVSIWLPYLNIDTIVFDYDSNDIDSHTINLDIKFSLVSNPNLGESVQINVNN
jgi:phage baseplate assembly protein W